MPKPDHPSPVRRHQEPNPRTSLPASRFIATPPDHPPVAHKLRRRLRLLAMLAAAGMLLAACDWPMFQYNLGRTGFNPTESAISAGNVSGLVQRFAAGTPVTGFPRAYSPPAVANGLVYVGSPDSGLYALDAATGAVRWTAPTVSTGYSPAVANGIMYVAAGGGLYALDATSGALRWTAQTSDDPWSSPAVANGVVYVGTKVSLDALDATTGALRWTAPTGSMVSSPAVNNGVVYASAGQNLYAFDATTGSMRWASLVGSGPSSPAVVNGVVYVVSGDLLWAVDAANGLALWVGRVGNTSAPAVANGVVYVGGGPLYAFDATVNANCSDLPGFPTWPFAPKSCEPLWTAPTLGYALSPAVANGVVYLSSTSVSPDCNWEWCEIQSAAQAFDATGNMNCSGTPKVCAPLWNDNIGDAWSPSSPAIANGVVYIPSDRLYAYALP